MSTQRFASPTNVFVPAATGLVVGFIREPGNFKLREYTQWFGSETKDSGTKKPIAGYWIYDPDAPVRIGPNIAGTANPDPQGIGAGPDNRFRWDPNTDRPPALDAAGFKFQTVQMERRNYGYQIDEQTDDAADMPLLAFERSSKLNIAMTVKTWRVVKMLENSANWPSTNVADANVLNGGKGPWSTASSDGTSSTGLAIRKSIIAVQLAIKLQTNGVVVPKDLRCVISPNLAGIMGSTDEIYNFVKFGPYSQQRAEGRNELLESYGMPRFYAGMEFVIEDAVAVTEEMNAAGTAATTNRLWVKNDTSAVVVARPGAVDGVQGSKSFSTVQIWYYKYEMAVEEMRDTWNKQIKGAIVDQFAEVPTALRAGYLITNCI